MKSISMRPRMTIWGLLLVLLFCRLPVGRAQTQSISEADAMNIAIEYFCVQTGLTERIVKEQFFIYSNKYTDITFPTDWVIHFRYDDMLEDIRNSETSYCVCPICDVKISGETGEIIESYDVDRILDLIDAYRDYTGKYSLICRVSQQWEYKWNSWIVWSPQMKADFCTLFHYYPYQVNLEDPMRYIDPPADGLPQEELNGLADQAFMERAGISEKELKAYVVTAGYVSWPDSENWVFQYSSMQRNREGKVEYTLQYEINIEKDGSGIRFLRCENGVFTF